MLSPEPAGKVSYYEKRKAVFPKVVSGPFRRFKWFMMVVTLGIY
ncbi:MAG: cytochrome c oxidase accessory protein CcoG, partial [Pseudomonadota bacterium]